MERQAGPVDQAVKLDRVVVQPDRAAPRLDRVARQDQVALVGRPEQVERVEQPEWVGQSEQAEQLERAATATRSRMPLYSRVSRLQPMA
jgi:hypothetical protein